MVRQKRKRKRPDMEEFSYLGSLNTRTKAKKGIDNHPSPPQTDPVVKLQRLEPQENPLYGKSKVSYPSMKVQSSQPEENMTSSPLKDANDLPLFSNKMPKEGTADIENEDPSMKVQSSQPEENMTSSPLKDANDLPLFSNKMPKEGTADIENEDPSMKVQSSQPEGNMTSSPLKDANHLPLFSNKMPKEGTADIENEDELDIHEVENVCCDSSGEEYVMNSEEEIDSSDDDNDEGFKEIRRQINHFDFDEVADDIVPEKENAKLFIRKVLKSNTTKLGQAKKCNRVYNSYQYCLPCKKKVSNFSQHLFRQHRTEPDVKSIWVLDDVRERKRAIGQMRQKFNHEHNLNSIQAGEGEIILHRRPATGEFILNEYGPCPDCLLWMQQKLLKRHSAHCLKTNKCDNSLGSLKTKSDALAGRINTEASKILLEEVFNVMRSDNVGKVAQSDPLIVALGNQWMDKNVGNVLKRGTYTSQIMRLCAKLLIELRKLKPLASECFSDYLVPDNFNELVQAVLNISSSTEEDETPSNAIKLGYDLKRLIDLKIVFCGIMKKDEQARKDAEDLLRMMKVLWGTRVTKAARVRLDSRKFQRKVPLPSAEDIVKLHDHLRGELECIDLNLETYNNFIKVAELSMVKIITYNRRRTGEVEAVRVDDYCRRTKGAVNDITELTEFEKNLLKTQDVMEVRGKTGRGVPIIIPQEVKKAMDFLASLDVRQKCGITSQYLFARKGDTIVRAYDALHKIATIAGIEEPSRVSSTQLRKYMATVTQVLDLKENQMNWVLNHLGHTLDVHKIYYRATSDVIERTQIAKILLIQDHAKLKEFANRKLEDIQMEELLETGNTKPDKEASRRDFKELMNKSVALSEGEEVEGETNKARSHLTRKPWTRPEEAEIRDLFADCFTRMCRPTVKYVEMCLRKSKRRGGLIHLRSKETLKKKMFRMIDALKQKSGVVVG